MERVIVTPGDVRGLGNIVSPKIVNDFGEYQANVSSSTATVNGESMTVYNSSYLVKSSLTMECSRWVESDANFTVTLTLKDSTDTAINGATVYIDVNGVVSNATTNSSGVRSFTINPNGNERLTIRAYYLGSNSISGSSVSTKVYSIVPEQIEIYGDNTITQTGDTLKLYGLVTGHDGLPVPGARVDFIEYNPELFLAGKIYTNTTGSDTVTLNKNIGQSWCVKTTNFVTIGATSNNKIEIYHGALTVLSGGTALVDAVELTEKKLTFVDGVLHYDESSVDLSSTSIDTSTLVRHQGTVNVCYSIDKFYTANDGRTSTSIDETGITVNGLSTSLYNYWVDINGESNAKNLLLPLTIDFDVVSATGTIRLYTVNNRDYGTDEYLEVYRTLLGLGATSNKHVQLVLDGETIKYYVDTVLVATDDFIWTERIGFGFRGYQNSSVKFKNFNIGGY